MEKRKHERAPLAFPLRFKIGDVDKFTEQLARAFSFPYVQRALASASRIVLALVAVER